MLNCRARTSAPACFSAEPLDDAAAKTQKGLRIFVRDTKPLNFNGPSASAGPEAAERERRRAKNRQPRHQPAPSNGDDGEVSLVMMLDLETECER